MTVMLLLVITYAENGIKSAYLHGNCRCFYMFCLFSHFVSNFAGFRMTVRAGVCKSWELVTGTRLGTWPEKCCKIQKNLSEYGNIFQQMR